MPLFNRTDKSTLPALTERANAAHATTEAALSVFSDVLHDLEHAAAELETLAEEHAKAAEQHRGHALAASSASTINRTRAAKIREHFQI
jgi:hypothetical protein